MTRSILLQPRRAARGLGVWISCWSLAVLFFACYSEPESGPSRPPPATGGALSGGTTAGGAPAADGGVATTGGSVNVPVCGDAVLDADESCDDGNAEDGDGCSARCEVEEPVEGACGDGARSANEECDDGNLQPGDGCDATCRSEECGNERIDAGEECDPPVAGECTDNCSTARPRCGDGVVHEEDEEGCDDGNEQPGDGCFECRVECGDGRIDRAAGEACDPAQSSACSDECQWLPVCGDGIVQSELGEECDPSRGNCVACKRVEPPPPPGCEGGAGGGNSLGGAGGTGECGVEQCVPSAAAQLVQNGDFQSGTTGWARHAASVEVRTSNDGPASPVLEVSLAASSVRSVSGAVQCIPISTGARYQFQAQYRIPSDAPAGVSASVMAFLYPGTSCQGEFVRPATSGPAGSVRGAWTTYQFNFDTSALNGSPGDEGRMLLRLGVIAPADAPGARVLWDGVSLSGRCGNCELDPGESCDDGNTEAGDGCTPTCRLEVCGDGVQSEAEECEDGNAVFGGEGDVCTPSCVAPTACDTCVAAKCPDQVAACLGLEGTAQAGPAAGIARSTLCDRLRTCVQDTACHYAVRDSGGAGYLENCYCGTTGHDCFEGRANGSCRAEVEAALETTDPLAIAQRFRGSVAAYPVTAALDALFTCENQTCVCQPRQRCGDGLVQDRETSAFTVVVDGEQVSCNDDFTHTGRGCSFEECDDADTAPGDGCDAQCFVEACGNRLVQAGEECDDGNAQSGDGCSSDCQLEFECGNSVVEPPFEHCDPPDASGGRVCTQAEFEQNPAQCACGSDCRRAVCGDGRIQRPAEQCDPPQAGFCTDGCRFVDQTPCQECIQADMGLGQFYTEFCTTAECIDVLQCDSQTECFAVVPSDCYCGIGASGDACEQPDFEAEGPCKDVIRAGLLDVGEEETLDSVNGTILDRWFATERPAGVAHSILNEIASSSEHPCYAACFPNVAAP